MSDAIRETAEEVAALIPRFTWTLMDEDQKDALMVKVVVVRYKKTTKDGVQLGPTWWAKTLGTTMSAIESRYRRIQAADQGKQALAPTPTTTQKAAIRAAKSAIRKHPDLAKQLYDDPKVKDAVDDVVLTSSGRSTSPRPRDLQQNQFYALWDLFVKLGKANAMVVRNLSDYVPDKDMSDEARQLADDCEATAEFLRAWANGTSIADGAEDALREWTSAG